MGEVPVKFGGEFEIGIESGSLDPVSAHLGGGDPVEGVVELDGVEVLGEIGQGVELRAFWGRVNDSLPIFVRPSCRANTDHRQIPFTAEHAEMNEGSKIQQDPSLLYQFLGIKKIKKRD